MASGTVSGGAPTAVCWSALSTTDMTHLYRHVHRSGGGHGSRSRRSLFSTLSTPKMLRAICSAFRRSTFRHHDASQRHSPMLHDDVDRRIHLDGVVPKQRVVVDPDGGGIANLVVEPGDWKHFQLVDDLLNAVHSRAPAQGHHAVANRDDDTANIVVDAACARR